MANVPMKWTSRLRNDIKRLMFRYDLEDDYQKFFITHEHLISAWNKKSDHETPWICLRQSVEYFSCISDEVFNDQWIRVVSVLIWIQHECWFEFLHNSLDSTWERSKSTPAAFRDEYLPFTRDELRWHLFKDSQADIELTRNFCEAQFAFKPVSLQQDKLLSFDDGRYRLPIKREGLVNDTGAYGLVTKAKIAAKHYFYKPDFSPSDFEPYPSDFDAARKEFGVGYDFAREHQNLKILRDTGINHSRIMQSFASVIIGDRCNLFFPWADLDLGRFLDGQTLYNDNDNAVTPYAMMKEALELLGALEFLHESIRVKNKNVVFSHLDLKPNNILVTRSSDISQYPVGKWKITDFGISNTEPRQEDTSRLLSARELFVRSKRPESQNEPSVELERYPGPYQPPEAEKPVAEQFKKENIRTPGDKSDIWSYGCILLDVLAFAIGGFRYTEILCNKRSSGDVCPDGELRTGYFYRRADDKNFRLHPHIRRWFEDDPSQRQVWLADIWEVLTTQMLRIYPPKRSSAKNLGTMLKRFVEERLPQANIWSDAQDQCEDVDTPTAETHTSIKTATRPDTSSSQLAIEFRDGEVVELDVKKAKSVHVSPDGSRILYQTPDRVEVFRASEEDGFATFKPQKTCAFPVTGQVAWNHICIAGDHVVLRKARDNRHEGKIEVYDLSVDHPQEQSIRMNQVENELVNGLCVSINGYVAVRYSKSICLLTSSGEPTHVELNDVLVPLRDPVKDIAFDRSGQILIAVLAGHWLMKSITNESSHIIARHGFCRPEHGHFLPSIVPFTGLASFLLHDTADPGRCLAILSSDPTPHAQLQFKEYQCRLTGSPEALTITPDNKRLLYVTRQKQGRFKKKYTYSLRGRSINLQDRSPVSAFDTWEMEMFERSEKLDINIAAISANGGYMVLIADVKGAVCCFSVE